MKIAVTKTFANYLNKLAKRGILKIDHAELRTYSANMYELHVGDVWEAEKYGDMDFDDEGNLVYKAIEIVYPYEFYACPKYLTTELLTTICRRHFVRIKTEDDLFEMLRELINI